MLTKPKESYKDNEKNNNKVQHSYILGPLNLIYSTSLFFFRLVTFPYILRP